MKLKGFVYFFSGVVLTGAFFLSKDFLSLSKTSPEETALGEMLYKELQKYPSEWEVRNIAKVMKNLSSGKSTLQPSNEREKILFEFAAKESEKMACENLYTAEAYLQKLANLPNVIPVVNDRVYVEILEKGTTQQISQNDHISILFKQYDVNGNIIKNTENQPFTIPLSRMIKGFKIGLEGAKVGETRKIYIHPEYGFGKIGRETEPNQLLIYEVQIKEVLD